MFTEINESDEKVLRVVFENKKLGHEEERAHLTHIEKTVKLECQLNSKNSKQAMERERAVICAELNKAKELKKKKIVNIAKAVENAHHRENVITDKFLCDVESMVTYFKIELDKMQELFGNIIKNLPQVHADVVVEA